MMMVMMMIMMIMIMMMMMLRMIMMMMMVMMVMMAMMEMMVMTMRMPMTMMMMMMMMMMMVMIRMILMITVILIMMMLMVVMIIIILMMAGVVVIAIGYCSENHRCQTINTAMARFPPLSILLFPSLLHFMLFLLHLLLAFLRLLLLLICNSGSTAVATPSALVKPAPARACDLQLMHGRAAKPTQSRIGGTIWDGGCYFLRYLLASYIPGLGMESIQNACWSQMFIEASSKSKER